MKIPISMRLLPAECIQRYSNIGIVLQSPNNKTTIYKLLCLINNNTNIIAINTIYDTNYILSDIQLLEYLKILYLSKINNIQIIQYNNFYHYFKKESTELIYKYIYLSNINNHWLQFLKHYFKFMSINNIKYVYKREYIYTNASKYMTAKMYKHASYIMMYNYVQKHDDFKQFNIDYNIMVKNINNILKTVDTDPKYIKFKKTLKPYKFTYNFNRFLKPHKHLYTPRIKASYNEFLKSLKQ
jgi:hypothetical protein